MQSQAFALRYDLVSEEGVVEDSPQAVELVVSYSHCQSEYPLVRLESSFAFTYMSARGSLRILNITPWSAKDLDRNVDSPIPGKLLGGDTTNCQY